MERKVFLKTFGLLIGGAVFFPGTLFASNNEPNAEVNWLKIIDYARWSPSPHNIQPWKIKVLSLTEAELYYSPERLIPVSDTGNKFMTIAMGIFIETLTLAAAGFGFKTVFEYYGNEIDHTKKADTAFGKLILETTNNIEIKFDKELILKRKTSRLHYQPCPVKEDVITSLNKIAKDFGHTFHATNDCEKVKAVIKLNSDTLFYDLNNDAVRMELDKWLRYTNEEAKTKKDGLWYHCMRFPGKLMRSFFHHHTLYNQGLVKKVIDKYYLNSMDNTKTIAYIKGHIATAENCIQTGRMLAQLWLEMTKYNVYMHPFGSVITNPEAHNKLKQILTCENDTWFLLRMGYSDTPPTSYRLNTQEIIIK